MANIFDRHKSTMIKGEPYLSLVGVVIDPSMHGFAAWLQGPCGRFWCEIGGLDSKTVFDFYYRALGAVPLPDYQVRDRCHVCKKTNIWA